MLSHEFEARCINILQQANYIIQTLFEIAKEYKTNNAVHYVKLAHCNVIATRNFFYSVTKDMAGIQSKPSSLEELYLTIFKLSDELMHSKQNRQFHSEFVRTVQQQGIVTAAENAAEFAIRMYTVFIETLKRAGELPEKSPLLKLLDAISAIA